MSHKIEWIDHGREPQAQSDPRYPDGVDVVDPCAGRVGQKTCRIKLRYPAKRCGHYLIVCSVCSVRISVSTAGRRDDPRSLTIACKPARH